MFSANNDQNAVSNSQVTISNICSPNKRLHIISLPAPDTDFYKNLQRLINFDRKVGGAVLKGMLKNNYVVTERDTNSKVVSPLGTSTIEKHTGRPTKNHFHHEKAVCTYQQIEKILLLLKEFIGTEPEAEYASIAQKYLTYFEAIAIDYRSHLPQLDEDLKEKFKAKKLDIDNLPVTEKTEEHRQIIAHYHETEETKNSTPTKITRDNKLASHKLWHLKDTLEKIPNETPREKRDASELYEAKENREAASNQTHPEELAPKRAKITETRTATPITFSLNPARQLASAKKSPLMLFAFDEDENGDDEKEKKEMTNAESMTKP